MGQHQILLVADADFAERIALGEVGDRVHLRRGGVAGRAAFRLERQGHDGVAGLFVVGDRIVHPGVEAAVGLARRLERARHVVEPFVARVGKPAGDVGNRRVVDRERAVLDGAPFGLDFLAEGLDAEFVHQDLDARLVDVVAAAERIVDAQDRLDVAQHVALAAGTA